MSTGVANGATPNYAREPYRRYLDRNLDGNYFYDAYGDFITRGYLVYDWRQTQPRCFRKQFNHQDGPLRGLV